MLWVDEIKLQDKCVKKDKKMLYGVRWMADNVIKEIDRYWVGEAINRKLIFMMNVDEDEQWICEEREKSANDESTQSGRRKIKRRRNLSH